MRFSRLVWVLMVWGTSMGAVAEKPLLGAAVGNADLLVAEGARLYNEQSYAQARDRFLEATRVAPQNLAAYLSLARAYFALQEYERACYTYRVYVKSAPESPDRVKAQSEQDLCERRLGGTREFSQKYVSLKANFYELLDQKKWTGTESASAVLRDMILSGYASVELGEMAEKLVQGVQSSAETTYQAVVNHQKTPVDEIRSASELYRLALEFGAVASHQEARAAFMEGMAFLKENQSTQAIASFETASQKDPRNPEPRFYRGLAKFLSGDKVGALRFLEAELPQDPRTGILKVALALDERSPIAAGELEKLLFAQRFGKNP